MLSRALEVPVGFFSSDCLHSGSIGEVHFRRKASTLAGERRYAVAMLNLATYVAHELSKQLGPPDPPYPLEALDIDEFSAAPENAARWVRSAWHLPPGPVSSLVRAVEASGAYVFLVDLGEDLFGLSAWHVNRDPVILINSAMPGDRCRWTLAHELGHLVLHTGRPPAPSMEEEADRFAAELLTPLEDLRPELRSVTIQDLGALKTEWGVSMQSLLIRARELGAATPYQVSQMFKLFAKKGWRKKEPYRLPVERTNLVPLLVGALVDQLGSVESVAEALNLDKSTFSRLVPYRRAPQAHGHLRLVLGDEGCAPRG